jgi:hypothetical protein
MLELAYTNKEKLSEKFLETVFNEKYKYYDFDDKLRYNISIADNSENSIEFVSKYENTILGYFRAAINRNCWYVAGLNIINFYDKNYTFSKDCLEFISMLFTQFNFYKINFCACVGSLAEKIDDKLVKMYGGKVAGYYVKDTKLWTGEYCDVKVYEILKNDYNKRKGENVK